jgi:hypothetical protein
MTPRKQIRNEVRDQISNRIECQLCMRLSGRVANKLYLKSAHILTSLFSSIRN